MTQESIDFLEKHKHINTILQQAGTLHAVDHGMKQGFLDVIHREWDGGYLATFWCGECVAHMITFCYVQYNKYLAGKK